MSEFGIKSMHEHMYASLGPTGESIARRQIWAMLESCDSDLFRAAVALMHEGLNNAQIGRELSISRKLVQEWRVEVDLPKTRRGSPQYSEEIVRMVIRLVNVNKISHVEARERIYEKFGMRPSEAEISKWVNVTGHRVKVIMEEYGKIGVKRHSKPFPLAAMSKN